MAALDWKSRLRAAGIHLLLSAAVAALAAALVFGLWYPWPYTVLAGGTELFVLITSVDVVIGPALTLAVFDRIRKPVRELQRDLAVIAMLQLAALVYGMHTIFVARPVALVFEVDRLRVVTAVDIPDGGLEDAPQDLRRLPLDGPRLLRIERPAQGAEKLEAIQMAVAGTDLSARPRYWHSWDATARAEVLLKSRPLAQLPSADAQRQGELDAAVKRSGRAADQLRYLPLQARKTDWIALIDGTSGDVVGYAPFNGF
ncbi:TfpX/TfpZ family type IV pilin accessory protein [Zoogloea sp.]|uniref:TfpX/TfpZ family type IV pilin accessory protein n=1 Tax=Zoogloea sp. TaxID=49181 RepID=UPI0025D39046|nr:TfpX/TfpZ family type IV pilin accessory protein [Zoogloea sp.]MCK6396635.1 hypothetical protein [Zoogloea sp.]